MARICPEISSSDRECESRSLERKRFMTIPQFSQVTYDFLMRVAPGMNFETINLEESK